MEFMTTIHVNTPVMYGTMLCGPMTCFEGSRLRWTSLTSTFVICTLLGLSASIEKTMLDYRTSGQIGMLAGISYAVLPRLGVYNLNRFVPAPVTTAIGIGLFAYHAAVYAYSTRQTEILDVPADDITADVSFIKKQQEPKRIDQ